MTAIPDRRAREHFEALSPEEKREAIRWLRDCGFSDHGIAHATRLSIEAVREILAAREADTE